MGRSRVENCVGVPLFDIAGDSSNRGAMTSHSSESCTGDVGTAQALATPLDAAITQLAAANAIAEVSPVFEVIEAARPLMADDHGLEVLFRLLAVARGDYAHPSVSAEHAHRFLAQVMAMNLDIVVSDLQEGDRLRPERLGYLVQSHRGLLRGSRF